jgi:hypothetical protein
VCGKKVLDDSDEDTEEPCADCRQTIHHVLHIELTVNCNHNHLTKQDGAVIIDSLTKLFNSRGLMLADIQLFQKYEWKDIPMENIKKLQELGILQQ